MFCSKLHTIHILIPSTSGYQCSSSELPPTTLAEILAPSALMFGHKFELSVDEWRFIGHPFSVQSDSFSIAFNVVFVFLVREPSRPSPSPLSLSSFSLTSSLSPCFPSSPFFLLPLPSSSLSLPQWDSRREHKEGV